MQPIVNGLQVEYGDRIDFVSLNAKDGAEGQAAFEFYGLRGHPTLVLLDQNGQTVWMRTGVVSEQDTEQALNELLNHEPIGEEP